MLSSELEYCLNEAYQKARDARHEYMTVEHLLLSILDAPRVREILKACGVQELTTVNVLEDEEIRQGIKEYANWPTIPQLYVKGEFVGGCDIVREMYETGELTELLNSRGVPVQLANPA